MRRLFPLFLALIAVAFVGIMLIVRYTGNVSPAKVIVPTIKGHRPPSVDTVSCHMEYIDKITEVTSASGKTTRFYAVYNDPEAQVSDLIPLSKEVNEYIISCKENNLTPKLGIELKDGQINRLVALDDFYLKHVIYENDGRRIYISISIESGEVACFTEINGIAKKVIFNHEYGYDSFWDIRCKKYDDDIFLVGDFMPNSNGWTVRFPVYKINKRTFDVSFVCEGAAVNFGSNGFKIAVARLTNEKDATCTADEKWLMHDRYFDTTGRVKHDDKAEYDYDKMVEKYGDNLVNAPGYGFCTK